MGYRVWYHGTSRENVASILQHGLRAKYYGSSYQGFGHPYLTLFRWKENTRLPARDVVITFHVPDEEAGEYLCRVATDGRRVCCNRFHRA